ncbi:MAG: hypothetical protein HY822_03595 [Acidobacteria bacterium]|nr:hypothetical protein [Acidobacteriota bacterium]
MKKSTVYALGAAALAALAIPAGSLLYEGSGGDSCARCHEIRPNVNTWARSAHRGVDCKSCHGGLATTDASFHLGNLRRLWKHLRSEAPERIEVRNSDILPIAERCRTCHRQEFAQWQAGPHSATFARLFTDTKHNRKRRLMDDCLRCHGMFFEGDIQDLVTPIDTAGPWRLKDASLANRAAIPCLACHGMHCEGAPMPRRNPVQPAQARGEELFRPSLALFDVRRREHIPAARLPLPDMLERERAVKISRDPRQSLCYQCHAPLASRQINSGDDRTPTGVHEGLSCLACHQKHSQQTRASCANCHPRLSNCGLDVEKMDTTFLNASSKHNVHFVTCADCHPRGVPPQRPRAQTSSQTAAASRSGEEQTPGIGRP